MTCWYVAMTLISKFLLFLPFGVNVLSAHSTDRKTWNNDYVKSTFHYFCLFCLPKFINISKSLFSVCELFTFCFAILRWILSLRMPWWEPIAVDYFPILNLINEISRFPIRELLLPFWAPLRPWSGCVYCSSRQQSQRQHVIQWNRINAPTCAAWDFECAHELFMKSLA